MPKQRSYDTGKDDPFAPTLSVAEVDAATYGAVDLPDSKRIVAKPIGIETVQPDPRQPRRTIPDAVRGIMLSRPGRLDLTMPEMFAAWAELVRKSAQITYKLEISRLIAAGGDSAGDMFGAKPEPIVEQFAALIALAGSIYRDGLVNPIRVARAGLIESGERRWLAYWLLHFYNMGDYAKIPAVQTQKIDVWAQAAENGARTPLNAIGMARQLALLVMDMYEGQDGVAFDAYETLVLPGESDRAYYAQVANGELYRVKRGMGDRVLQVTGLKSRHQISQYRALLSIPDALWQKADEQNWTEFEIRQYAASLNNTPKSADTFTGVNVSPESGGDRNAPGMASSAGAAGQNGGAARSSPPKTSIGVRMGLYDDAPAARPKADNAGVVPTRRAPAPVYDEDYVPDDDIDEDDDEAWDELVQESIDALEADELALTPEPIESTTAIADEWTAAGKVLKFLKSASSDEVTRAQMTELLTLSREDVRRMVQMSDAHGGWWHGLMAQRAEEVRKLLDAHLYALLEFIKTLQTVGDEFARNRRG